MSYDSSKSIYDRVRIVSIDTEGLMSCSCGKVQTYLMPYHHICAINSMKRFYVPSMIHIRWHKVYNYYHGNNFCEKLASHCTGTINDIICWTRANFIVKVVLTKECMLKIQHSSKN